MNYKRLSCWLCLLIFISACNDNKNLPDISDIKVSLNVQRFDEDFFGIDTNNINGSLDKIQAKYPEILPVFLRQIVGAEDSSDVINFYRFYKPVFDSSRLIYKDLDDVRKPIEKALRYVKYYFPDYKVQNRLVTVIGRMDSRQDMARMNNGEYTPDFLGEDFLGISLQFYLGSDFSLYSDEYFINNVAPLYRSRRFEKSFIPGDVMKLVVDDLFPDKSSSMPLAEQMIEKGKRWWLLDKFMPEVHDSVKTGYTGDQLEWCQSNEGQIWNYIIKNENLDAIDPRTLQTYIGEGPFTNVFPQEYSPGNIGPWIGWQILKKFESAQPDLSIRQIMETPARKILEEAKYRPK